MRWFIVPISVCAHAVAAVLLFIIPLAAEVEPPVPAARRALFMAVKVVTPPAGDVRPPSPPQNHVSMPAPTVAPSEISKESPTQPLTTGGDETPGPPGEGLPGPTGGLPDSVGVPLAGLPTLPPPPPSRPLPLPIGGAIRTPKKIVDVPPVYPNIARATKLEGFVILEAVINERGEVERVRVLRSTPLLDAAAVDAVKGWRYTPTFLNNVPVPVLITITINFKLSD